MVESFKVEFKVLKFYSSQTLKSVTELSLLTKLIAHVLELS